MAKRIKFPDGRESVISEAVLTPEDTLVKQGLAKAGETFLDYNIRRGAQVIGDFDAGGLSQDI